MQLLNQYLTEHFPMTEASRNPPNGVFEDQRVETCFQEEKQNHFHLDLSVLKRTSSQCHWGLTEESSHQDANLLKIEDLIRKAIIIKEVAGNHILSSSNSPILWDSHDLLKLMKEILSLAAQDLLAGNKIQMIPIYRYIDVWDF